MMKFLFLNDSAHSAGITGLINGFMHGALEIPRLKKSIIQKVHLYFIEEQHVILINASHKLLALTMTTLFRLGVFHANYLGNFCLTLTGSCKTESLH